MHLTEVVSLVLTAHQKISVNVANLTTGLTTELAQHELPTPHKQTWSPLTSSLHRNCELQKSDKGTQLRHPVSTVPALLHTVAGLTTLCYECILLKWCM